jgi:Protein of unknown function (DUF3485)
MGAKAIREPAFLVALLVLTSGAVGLYFAIESANVYLTKLEIHARSGLTVMSLPTETAHWVRIGTDQIESAEVVEELGTEEYLTRTYIEKEGVDGKPPRLVQLHIAYYTGMIDTVPHVPDRCFVGSGLREGGEEAFVPIALDDSTWMPIGDVRDSWAGQVYSMKASNEYGQTGGARVTLPRKPYDIKMRTMNFIDDQSSKTLYAGYFFIANGGTVARAEGVRMMAFDLSDDYAYYLKVQVNSQSVHSAEELGEVASSLLNDLIGDIMFCLPDWVEVDQGLWPLDNPRRKDGADPDASDSDR